MKDWVEQVRAEGWVIADMQSCPGYEAAVNECRCPCVGCKHHCSAHREPVFSPYVEAVFRAIDEQITRRETRRTVQVATLKYRARRRRKR